ncbi:hypothetical protein HDU93_007820 [Gonapodya sp. JEL0774]|nr:hypothetical protein HDU93_007820 [Gonapodya sp. JEL0774]
MSQVSQKRSRIAMLAIAGAACLIAPSSAQNRTTNPDAIIQLSGAVNFCMILPPAANLIIPDHEYDAVSYCPVGSTITSSAGRTLPAGFVVSAHYVKTPNNEFAQVSGTYDPATFGLFANDTGGQYDSDGIGCGGLGCPIGATCQGYSSFIQMIGSGTYCLRCCNDATYCPVDRDREGCGKVMGGNYGAGFTEGAVSLPTNGTNLVDTTGTPTNTTPIVAPAGASSAASSLSSLSSPTATASATSAGTAIAGTTKASVTLPSSTSAASTPASATASVTSAKAGGIIPGVRASVWKAALGMAASAVLAVLLL